MTPAHDVVGVGIGPFNLGLAALLDGVAELDAIFFDAKSQFAWHPGLMLDEAEVQVPFLADLVTLADPTSPHSFLSYLHARERLYRFYFHERLHVLRREFEAYYRWVSERLPTLPLRHARRRGRAGRGRRLDRAPGRRRRSIAPARSCSASAASRRCRPARGRCSATTSCTPPATGTSASGRSARGA